MTEAPLVEPEARHVLVVANETVAGRTLIEAIERRARKGPLRVTVVCPVSRPREGYVVYEDTRRAAAGRRLDRTLTLLREEGISSHGLVVDASPIEAVRDAVAQLKPDEIIVSTHPELKSGWLRRNVVDGIRRAAGALPVEHVVVDLSREGEGPVNVLVVANETVLGEPLLDRIRERAARSQASFLIVAPQGEAESSYEDAERRLRQELVVLRGAGTDVHGQIAHPDPYTATMQALRDERIDEIIVSTYPEQRSGWLRRDLVGRLKKDCDVPVVDHVVVDPRQARAGATA